MIRICRLGKRGKKDITAPVCVMRFSILTSSPFTTGTVDAKVKETDAKSAQARQKSAKPVMENWLNGTIVRQGKNEPDRGHL